MTLSGRQVLTAGAHVSDDGPGSRDDAVTAAFGEGSSNAVAYCSAAVENRILGILVEEGNGLTWARR